jgi:hypothetical protein
MQTPPDLTPPPLQSHPYTGLVIALINSFNLFWIACTWAWVGGLEMLWLNTATLGFSAEPEIPLAALFAFTSMIDLRPVNWFRNSDDEMSELFTGNVGSNGISLLQKKKFGRPCYPLPPEKFH